MEMGLRNSWDHEFKNQTAQEMFLDLGTLDICAG